MVSMVNTQSMTTRGAADDDGGGGGDVFHLGLETQISQTPKSCGVSILMFPQIARFEIFHRFSSLINLRHQVNLHSAKGMILRLSLHFSQLFRDSESDHGRPLEFFLLS